MSRRREILELGVAGRVPVDTLFELHLETRRGDALTICQTRCQASIGGWVFTTPVHASTHGTHRLAAPLGVTPFEFHQDLWRQKL